MEHDCLKLAEVRVHDDIRLEQSHERRAKVYDKDCYMLILFVKM